ncbi:MAG TPA: hypothetical protein VN667_21240 [Burkholderiales bacterium]|nr:hypothetical protein [Burkholderiales bacterium]
MKYEDVLGIYLGSDGEATKALYDRLAALGPAGEIALNLFRAQKNSSRAKGYRGGVPGKGSFRRMAYDRKEWAMENLAAVLGQHGAAQGVTWGWAIDPGAAFHNVVLYVDIPTGQISFHSGARGAGPDYCGSWDGELGVAPGRICRWISTLLQTVEAAA